MVVATALTAKPASSEPSDRLRATIEGSLDCVYLLDALRDEKGVIVDLVFVDVNQRGLDLIGMARDEVVGQPLCELLPVNRTEGFFDRYVEVIESGTPLEDEFPIELPQGDLRWLRHQVVKVGDGVAIATRDVTERKLADDEQRDTAEKLAAVVQSSPLAILALDVDGRVTMWNAAAERLFGFATGEVLGRRLPTIPGDRREEYEELRARALAGREVLDVHTTRLTKDGELVDVSLSLAPLRDASGRISGHLTILVDLTERRRLEEQVTQAQKMEALGRLAAGIAHDFNNVLTAITGYADLVLGRVELDDAGVRHDVEQIREAAERAAGLTRELLAFGRPGAVGAAAVDVSGAAAGMQDFLHHLVRPNVELAFEAAPEPCFAQADRGRLQQILVNLVGNASDAIPDGGVVTIRTRRVTVEAGSDLARQGLAPGAHVALAVADDGVGMDAATVARAFEPFFTTKQEGRGTGLGLAIVYWAVTQSGGRVQLESSPGQGTTVTVYLPAARPPGEEPPDDAAARTTALDRKKSPPARL